MGIYDYFDTLMARTCHNQPLPCSKDKKKCVTEQMRNRAFDYQNFVIKYWFKTGKHSKEMNRISGTFTILTFNYL